MDDIGPNFWGCFWKGKNSKGKRGNISNLRKKWEAANKREPEEYYIIRGKNREQGEWSGRGV